MCTSRNLRVRFGGLLLVLLWLVSPRLWAAECAAIWPDRDTSQTTARATLPAFTGTTQLNLNRTLGAGDFHFASSSESSGDLSVNGGPTTRIYINGNLIIGGNTDLNQNGDPEDLIIIVNGDLNFNSSWNTINVNAIIYATGNVNLNNDVVVNGTVTAEGWVNNPSRINYDSNAVANADFGTLCGAAEPVLEMVSLECGANDRLIVSFSDASDQTALSSSAEVTGNYVLQADSGTVIGISDAELADNGFEVILTLATPLTAGENYTLTVSNISDEEGTTLASASASVYYTTTQTGLVGEYYYNSTLTDPVTEYRVESQVYGSWNSNQTPFGSGTSGFSMRWEGYFVPASTGTYQFRTYSDDGVRLWVDDLSDTGNINNWTDHSATWDQGSGLALEAGVSYPLRLEYYNRSANGEQGEIQLQWRLNSGSYGTSSAALNTCRAAPDATNGLVVHYTLDGPTWNGTANEVLDSAGGGVHGNIVNGAISTPARVCNGAELDGSNFIRIQDNVALDLTDELTVTAWINLSSFSNELRAILSKDENYEFHIDRNGAIYWWWNSNGGTRSFDSGSSRISLNTWHHVAIVYADGRQSIYLNGNEVAFRTYSGETLVTNADPLEIGADQGLSNRNWVGQIDEVKIFKQPLTQADVQDVMNETHPCANALDAFTVTAAASASVCAPTTVTITATQSDGSTYSTFTGAVDIATSSAHGNWSIASASGSLSPNPDNDDNGAVQYTFVSGDNGSAQLYLSNTHADQLTVTAIENGGTATGTSGTISFSENALQIDVVDGWGSDFVAGRDHALRIQALRLDPSTGSCGLFTEYQGDIDLKAWISRSAEDPGGVAPAITTTSGSQALPNAEPGANNVTLNFSAGEAFADWVTTDVGQYGLTLKDDSSGQLLDIYNNPLPIEGSLSPFTVRPFGFYLEAVGNPAATDVNGGAYVRAGESFTLNVTAVGYQALDDGDGDHHPDPGANLSDNPVTAAFGQEQNGAAESVALSATLLLPAAAEAHDPGLLGTTSVSGFSAGTAATTVRYDEVGIIELNAVLTDTSYLGAANVSGQIANVGRFYPAYFSVTDNGPALRDATGSWTCPFTYQGQPFGFDTEPLIAVQAFNMNGDATENYSGDFWKLDVPTHSIELDVNSLPTGSACESGGAVVAGCLTENSATVNRNWSVNNDYDGNGVVVTDDHSLILNKLNATPDGGDVPYSPALDYRLAAAALTDGDGACYQASGQPNGSCADYLIDDITGTDIRWGRAWVDSALGSVLTPLPVTLRLQYWNSSAQFQLNEDDDYTTCAGTLVQSTDLSLSNYSGELNAGETSVSTVTGYPGYYISTLSAPGYQGNTANAGSVLLNWVPETWLQFDIDGDGASEDPAGVATFVGQPANQPVLFRRERFR
ncbi:MAG: DUF6701 domain-containing protein [Pseudomonadota bacterium]|nr:DUF6701 domain-containing protein [Pseudomonadota bacterium]